MAITLCEINWDNILELTKTAENKGDDPMLWAIQLSSTLNSAGVSLPSPELATLLVSHICWDNNVPIAWKFLEKALIFNIVPPILVLALLSKRYILCLILYVFPFSCLCLIWSFCVLFVLWGDGFFVFYAIVLGCLFIFAHVWFIVVTV